MTNKNIMKVKMNKEFKTCYGYHIDETIKFLRRFVKVDIIDIKLENEWRSVLVKINGFTMWIKERPTCAYIDMAHEVGCNDFDGVAMKFAWSEG